MDEFGTILLSLAARRASEQVPHLGPLVEAVCNGRSTSTADGVSSTADGVEEQLEALSERSRELGWVFAVAASAAGQDTLLARRDPRGLAPLLELVDQALIEGGFAALGPLSGLPELAPSVGEGWQLPWSIAALLFEAGSAGGRGDVLDWSLDPRLPGMRVALPERGVDRGKLLQVVERVRGWLPEALVEQDETELRVAFPAGWLQFEADR